MSNRQPYGSGDGFEKLPREQIEVLAGGSAVICFGWMNQPVLVKLGVIGVKDFRGAISEHYQRF